MVDRLKAPHQMKIVLFQPEIPGNTGTIGRTCVGLDMELILIRPYGFELSEKSVRRAGLDYWKYVRLSEYDDWHAFIAARSPRKDQLFLFENDRAKCAYEVDFPKDAYLVFGRETTGLSPEIITAHEDRLVSLPMYSGYIRSLNLANIACAAAYQALRSYALA